MDGRREVKERSSGTFSEGSRLELPRVYDRLGAERNMVFWAKLQQTCELKERSSGTFSDGTLLDVDGRREVK